MRLVLGTRGSQLACAQTKIVAEMLTDVCPDLDIQVRIIRTFGDENLGQQISQLGRGAFVKEIETQLLTGGIDVAVHSLKDMPIGQPKGLQIACTPQRADPRDALVLRSDLRELPLTARIATCSVRRQMQLRELWPQAVFFDIRGNVDTRLKKLETEGLDGLALACAGLERLGKGNVIFRRFSETELVPSPGQGILAIESRNDDSKLNELLNKIDNPSVHRAARIERSFLAATGADCEIPVGACYQGGRLLAFLGKEDKSFGAHADANVSTEEEARSLADALMERVYGRN